MAKKTDTAVVGEVCSILKQEISIIDVNYLNNLRKSLPPEVSPLVENALSYISSLPAARQKALKMLNSKHPDAEKQRNETVNLSIEAKKICADTVTALENYLAGKPINEPQKPIARELPRETLIPGSSPTQLHTSNSAPVKNSETAELEQILEQEIGDAKAQAKVSIDHFKEEINELSEYATKEFVRIQKALSEFGSIVKTIEGYNLKDLNKNLPETLSKIESFAKLADKMPEDYAKRLDSLFEKFAGLPKGEDVEKLFDKYVKIESKVDDIYRKVEAAEQKITAYETKAAELEKIAVNLAEVYKVIADLKFSKEDVQLFRAFGYNLKGTLSDITTFAEKTSKRKKDLEELSIALDRIDKAKEIITAYNAPETSDDEDMENLEEELGLEDRASSKAAPAPIISEKPKKEPKDEYSLDIPIKKYS